MVSADLEPIIRTVIDARVAIDLLFIADEHGHIAGKGHATEMREIEQHLGDAHVLLHRLQQGL